MPYSDDLLAVLKLGWEATRQAWQLMCPEADVDRSPQTVLATGRAIDQLAYDLRRLGYGKPSRLAYSVAFVLNGIGSESLVPDEELAARTLQILSILAEMMFELEANAEITAQEPHEAVEQLRVRWGMAEFDDSPASERTKPAAVPQPSESPIVLTSRKLLTASERLMQDVERDELCPYAAAVSQILYLSTTLHEALNPVQAADRPSDLAPAPVPDTVVQTQTPIATQILIADESPFVRTLWTTALESAGYTVMSTPRLGDLSTLPRVQLVLCDVAELAADPVRWRQALESLSVIALTNGSGASECPLPETPVFRRTDVTPLLLAIQSRIGLARTPADAA